MDKKDRPRIVFMGTPEFAVSSLEALIEADFNIVGVVTSTDKQAGRGMKVTMSAVKKAALAHQLPVLQPKNLKSTDFLDQLKELKPDLQVVVAFRMLPEVVWSLPEMGTINLHASLLPQYRGAAPINHVIINGEKETGVTTFKLQHAIDTGNILLQEKVTIEDSDDAGTLHDKLMHTGATLLIKTINGILDHTIEETDQSELSSDEPLKGAPKIFREDCAINWNRKAADIHNFIRGLTPYPGAFSFLKEKRIIITQSEVEQARPVGKAGAYVTDGKHFLKINASDGFIKILRLKPEGKREMSIEDFLRGHRDL